MHTDRGAWVAGADRAVWTPAGIGHRHRAYGKTVVHALAFAPDDAPLPGDAPTVIAVTGLLRELITAATEPDLTAAETGRLRAVLHDRIRRAHLAPITLPQARDPRLRQVCRLVEEDLATPRTTAWLAARAGTSERTLARLFRAEFGVTYPQWRTRLRVFHAMVELAAGATVTQAGHRCGWATTSAFVSTFAKTTGQTPGAYRVTRP